MTTPPARRKSSLVGQSPLAPPQSAAAPVPGRDLQVAEAPAGHESVGKKPKYPPKVSFYQDPEDSRRLRAAYRHNLAHSEDRSLSDFINRVVMAEVQRLEDTFNNGQPFAGGQAGDVPKGRPLGE